MMRNQSENRISCHLPLDSFRDGTFIAKLFIETGQINDKVSFHHYRCLFFFLTNSFFLYHEITNIWIIEKEVVNGGRTLKRLYIPVNINPP